MAATATEGPVKVEANPFAPPAVGEPYTYTVTYSGPVKSISDDGSLVIGAHTVPRRTGDGVIMCMIGEPEQGDGGASGPSEATRDFIRAEAAAEQAERAEGALADLVDLVKENHDATHVGPFKFCPDTVCRHVGEK